MRSKSEIRKEIKRRILEELLIDAFAESMSEPCLILSEYVDIEAMANYLIKLGVTVEEGEEE